jgi:hypothetical protein
MDNVHTSVVLSRIQGSRRGGKPMGLSVLEKGFHPYVIVRSGARTQGKLERR